MRIVSVIEIEDNVVKDVESFGIYEEQLSDDVVSEAEKLFEKKVTEMNLDLTEDELEEALEDGHYTIMNQSVCLVWSSIE